ncbi:CYTH domain-containing protein [Paenibacillus sp. NPDC058071]|uniref:CYTH domain-containing protein n=1 Tax=Paenibacillus sp. NPDC058071 TaxID=3346326 RepID=UPI0036D7929C
MALEVERKFMPAGSVDFVIEAGGLKVLSEQRIEQTYLAIDSKQELRIRKITDRESGEVTYTHTFKKGNGLVREEIEYEISESIYQQVADAFGAIPLTKDRITAQWGERTVEIDRYDQIELTVLEVEFESEAEAVAFDVPEWFGPDVSSERKYSNKTVWMKLQQGDKPV